MSLQGRRIVATRNLCRKTSARITVIGEFTAIQDVAKWHEMA